MEPESIRIMLSIGIPAVIAGLSYMVGRFVSRPPKLLLIHPRGTNMSLKIIVYVAIMLAVFVVPLLVVAGLESFTYWAAPTPLMYWDDAARFFFITTYVAVTGFGIWYASYKL